MYFTRFGVRAALFRVLKFVFYCLSGARLTACAWRECHVLAHSVSLRWRFHFVVSCLLSSGARYSTRLHIEYTRIDTRNGIRLQWVMHTFSVFLGQWEHASDRKMKLKCRVRVTRSEAVVHGTHFELNAYTADTSTTVIITIKYNAIYIITIDDGGSGSGCGHNWSIFERAKGYLSTKISFLLVSLPQPQPLPLPPYLRTLSSAASRLQRQ